MDADVLCVYLDTIFCSRIQDHESTNLNETCGNNSF